MSNNFAFPEDLQDPVKLLEDLKTEPDDYWIKRGEVRVLDLFHQMSQRVLAYKDFLKKNKVDPKKIKTIKDFKLIPFIDKENYLRKYPLEMLCWDGVFDKKRWTIAATSGSSGEPFYFPREKEQDLQYALTAELYLRSNFEIHKKSTLYIDAWAMGVWIGGLFTYQAIKFLAERGDYNLSIVTTGIFKEEILGVIKNLAPKFDQVLMGGYPPFIKDIIDDGLQSGLDWKKYNIKFIFSADGFSENFRDYILAKTGLKNPYRDTLNHYGTADLGTMAHETPLSILVRRLAIKHLQVYKIFFHEDRRLPTVAQYMPELFYFEEIQTRLFCSAFSGIPLLRYDLKDNGGVLNLREIKNNFNSLGFDLLNEVKSAKITDLTWNLPIVYVYERRDQVVKLYGANIYPETIRKVIQNKEFEDLLTGKFTILVKTDKEQNQYLEINVELKKGQSKNNQVEEQLKSMTVKKLLEENSEYQSNYKESPDRQIPNVVLWNYEDPLYFKPGIKQRWVRK